MQVAEGDDVMGCATKKLLARMPINWNEEYSMPQLACMQLGRAAKAGINTYSHHITWARSCWATREAAVIENCTTRVQRAINQQAYKSPLNVACTGPSKQSPTSKHPYSMLNPHCNQVAAASHFLELE
jgi:hypothetical protein